MSQGAKESLLGTLAPWLLRLLAPRLLDPCLLCSWDSLGQTPGSSSPAPGSFFPSFRSKFVAPSVEEGFGEIVRVNVVPQFATSEQERFYNMHLLEK